MQTRECARHLCDAARVPSPLSTIIAAYHSNPKSHTHGFISGLLLSPLLQSTVDLSPLATCWGLSCRNSKAPFTFVVQLMVPGPPFLSLVMAWAADYDPSKPAHMDTPMHQAEGQAAFSPRADPDSDSELTQSPFDLCLARWAPPFVSTYIARSVIAATRLDAVRLCVWGISWRTEAYCCMFLDTEKLNTPAVDLCGVCAIRVPSCCKQVCCHDCMHLQQ